MTEKKSLIDIIKEHMAAGDIKLPVLSQSAEQLQNEVTKEDPDMEKVENYITMDPAITGEVLKVANSSYYKGIGTVDTIKEASLRIGISELANLVMLVLHRENFSSTDPYINNYLEQLWKHSLASAVGSQWLAKYLALEHIAGTAFIAGMMHDMGKLFLITAVEDIKKLDKDFNPPTFLIEKMITGLHTEQGYDLLQNWNLPEAYCIVARDHHEMEFDTGNMLLAIVRLVNRVCNKMGIGPACDEEEPIVGSIEVDLLDLSEIAIAELEIKIEDSMGRFN